MPEQVKGAKISKLPRPLFVYFLAEFMESSEKPRFGPFGLCPGGWEVRTPRIIENNPPVHVNFASGIVSTPSRAWKRLILHLGSWPDPHRTLLRFLSEKWIPENKFMRIERQGR
jgi:hypothetical protein